MENYEKLEKIGEGTYATVYKARHIPSGQIVALKDIFVNEDEGCPSTALREIAILKELSTSCTHIVRLLQVLHGDSSSHRGLTLVFEYCERDLKQLLDDHSLRLGLDEIAMITKQIMSAVYECHVRGIIHRDIKPQNILVASEQDMHVKLADFGLARGTGVPVAGYSPEVVTLWYRAPELLLGSTTYGPAVDVWAVGACTAEMIRSGQALIPGRNADDQWDKTLKVLGVPRASDWEDFIKAGCDEARVRREMFKNQGVVCSEDKHDVIQTLLYPKKRQHQQLELEQMAVDFCRGCLEYSPFKRFTAQQALQHPFLARIHLSIIDTDGRGGRH